MKAIVDQGIFKPEDERTWGDLVVRKDSTDFVSCFDTAAQGANMIVESKWLYSAILRGMCGESSIQGIRPLQLWCSMLFEEGSSFATEWYYEV